MTIKCKILNSSHAIFRQVNRDKLYRPSASHEHLKWTTTNATSSSPPLPGIPSNKMLIISLREWNCWQSRNSKLFCGSLPNTPDFFWFQVVQDCGQTFSCPLNSVKTFGDIELCMKSYPTSKSTEDLTTKREDRRQYLCQFLSTLLWSGLVAISAKTSCGKVFEMLKTPKITWIKLQTWRSAAEFWKEQSTEVYIWQNRTYKTNEPRQNWEQRNYIQDYKTLVTIA